MAERFVRFLTPTQDQPQWGRCDGDNIQQLSAAPWLDSSRPTQNSFHKKDVRLLAPAEPTKIIAFGYNYTDLFEDKQARVGSNEPFYTESNFEPVVFLKGNNTLTGPEAQVQIPPYADEVWVEVELAILIGKKVKNIKTQEQAQEAIFGYTIGNDVTALNIFKRDWHLARSKSLDGFCPLGPELVTGGFQNAPLSLAIDGKTTQNSHTSNRILKCSESVLFASKLMTLEPGDVILTGTPLGARQSLVKPGCTVEAKIEGLGTLRNKFIRGEI